VGGWPDSAETAVRLLRVLAAGRTGAGFASDTVPMQQRLAWALTFRGHLREARTLIGDRFGPPFTELALLGVVPVDTADALVARWFQSADRPSLRFGRDDRCHRSFDAASWWASRGDTASLQRLVRRGDSEARSASSVYALYKARGDAELGRAALPLARRDTAEALRRFLAFPDSLCALSPRAIHLLRFHLLAAVGRDRDAAAAFDRSVGSTVPYPWHAAWVLGVLERGRVAERLDDRATAIRSYQYVVDAWRRADPELGRYVEEARAGLARLARESRR
jgi:hypothetical protein